MFCFVFILENCNGIEGFSIWDLLDIKKNKIEKYTKSIIETSKIEFYFSLFFNKMDDQDIYDYMFDDKVHVKLLFYNRDIQEKPNYESMQNIGEFELPKEIKFQDMMNVIIKKCNSLLPEILKKLDIKQFIPYNRATQEMKNGYLEVCYHHDKNKYEFYYNSDPFYVLTPIAECNKLKKIYNDYLLNGWWDPLNFME